jgi:hypothetical protein
MSHSDNILAQKPRINRSRIIYRPSESTFCVYPLGDNDTPANPIVPIPSHIFYLTEKYD